MTKPRVLVTGRLFVLGLIASTGLLWAGSTWTSAQTRPGAKPQMMVYKSSTCGCCKLWIKHMEENGFVVKSADVPDIDKVKADNGVPRSAASCHTGIVNGYVVEGHVPADAVLRLLREKPADIKGIAVPGMPVGSPGMELEGGFKQSYAIVTIDKAGKTKIYERR